MNIIEISSSEEFQQLQEYVNANSYTKIITRNIQLEDLDTRDSITLAFDTHEAFTIPIGKIPNPAKQSVISWIKNFLPSAPEKSFNKNLIFGKNDIQKIVSCEVLDDNVELFIEDETGVRSEFIPNEYWILADKWADRTWGKLEGNLFYKWIKKFKTRDEFIEARRKLRSYDTFSVWDDKSASMILQGFSYFKGMKIDEVSILGFDIESTSLEHGTAAKVLLISNTFRKNGVVERKLFAYDDYDSEAEFFDAWTAWVREKNPSIMLGHNIFGFDFRYLDFCANRAGTALNLGRDGSAIKFNDYDSDFRIDGSKTLAYRKAFIYGREIIDTMFLSYRYDIGKKYESYGLKPIIKHEGLEVEGRQFYDAGQIRYKYKDPEEWSKIKQYAIHDADDAVALFDLMTPSFFYFNQSVPKSFQELTCSATGSQLNSILVRSYLQKGHSIPKPSDSHKFEGAISFGVPGVFHNALKIDISSLYPSIIIQYQLYNRIKDPNGHFLQMVEYFTKERLENKRRAKETGDKYYTDLEQSQKIAINSSYGLCGTNGLHFNSFRDAEFITRKGRDTIEFAVMWATNKTVAEIKPASESDSEDEDES